MQKPKLITTTCTATAQQVFDAVLGVVQAGRYELVALDNDAHVLAFTSGKTALSWGQQYVATIETTAGGAQLQLMTGGVDGRPQALLDGWKNAKAGAKVVAAVGAALDGSAPAPASPVATFGSEHGGLA
ncbi:MAG: hypothetical protein ABW075_05435 [Aeromicrobium sp.]